MTSDEMSGSLALQLGIPKSQAARAIRSLTELVAEALKKGERVSLPKLGALSVRNRPSSSGRNPRTGEAISIPSRKVVKFSAASSLGIGLNGSA